MQNPAVKPEHNTETLASPPSHGSAWESFERKKNEVKERILVGKKNNLSKKIKNYLNKAELNAPPATICLLVGLWETPLLVNIIKTAEFSS